MLITSLVCHILTEINPDRDVCMAEMYALAEMFALAEMWWT
jgi:hypothetical protein